MANLNPSDFNIDEIRALQWISRVRAELEQVEKTTDKVRDECWKDPLEGDTVYECLETAGKVLDNAWTETKNAYRNAWGILEDGLGKIQQVGQRVQDAFEDLVSKVRR